MPDDLPTPIDQPELEDLSTLTAEGLDVFDNSSPWRNPDQFQEKPHGFLFGVSYQNQPDTQPFGNEPEFLDTIQADHRDRIDSVYIPSEDTAVPLSSLSCYLPLQKGDLAYHFLRVLRTHGLVIVVTAAIGFFFYKKADPNILASMFIVGLIFGIMPIIDAVFQWAMYPGKKSHEELKRNIVHNSVFNQWIRSASRSPLPIWLPLLIFLTVYLSQLFAGNSYQETSQSGTIHPFLIREQGQWWRLLTGTLMHAEVGVILHIGLNSLGFLVLGRFIHRLTFPLMVPIVFVVSAMCGAVASTTLLPLMHSGEFGATPVAPEDGMGGSLGASGGVLGMLGFLFILIQTRKNAFPYEFRSLLIRNIVLIAALGAIAFQFVDNAGHGGGFIGGALCALVYQLSHRNKWDVPHTPIKLVLGIGSLAILFFGLAVCLDMFWADGFYISQHLPRITW